MSFFSVYLGFFSKIILSENKFFILKWKAIRIKDAFVSVLKKKMLGLEESRFSFYRF